jgi:hypothetical protein
MNVDDEDLARMAVNRIRWMCTNVEGDLEHPVAQLNAHIAAYISEQCALLPIIGRLIEQKRSNELADIHWNLITSRLNGVSDYCAYLIEALLPSPKQPKKKPAKKAA